MEPTKQATLGEMNAKITSIARSLQDITNLLEALLIEVFGYRERPKQPESHHLRQPTENVK